MTDNQGNNKALPIAPYMWKKGQSGNPAGRPKGKTMKEYAKELLECQTEEERQEFLHGLSKDIIWKMAEGNPKESSDVKHTGEIKTSLPAQAIAIIEEDLKRKKTDEL